MPTLIMKNGLNSLSRVWICNHVLQLSKTALNENLCLYFLRIFGDIIVQFLDKEERRPILSPYYFPILAKTILPSFFLKYKKLLLNNGLLVIFEPDCSVVMNCPWFHQLKGANGCWCYLKCCSGMLFFFIIYLISTWIRQRFIYKIKQTCDSALIWENSLWLRWAKLLNLLVNRRSFREIMSSMKNICFIDIKVKHALERLQVLSL